MSRIHEALKRAEQERALQVSPQVTAASSPSVVAETPEVYPPSPAASAATRAPEINSIPTAVGTQVVIPEARPAINSKENLTFEDVWTRCAKPSWNPDPGNCVFTNPNSPASAAEQFRTLRSRLHQIREKKPLRSILVTSALPAEGKTFVAANLAQALARQKERHVLLVDADLRRSQLHLAMGAPSSPGLSDYLCEQADEMAVIQRSEIESLCLIAGGSEVSNPTELIANGRLKILLKRLANAFDWIVVDSPPALPVSDSILLADLCEGVLMVVRAAHTPFDTAQKISQEFRGKNLLGVVLNRVEDSEAYYGAYYGSHHGNNGQPQR